MQNAECGIQASQVPHSEFRTPHSMHTIRLRGPWKAWPAQCVVRHTRRFHRPTGLAPGQSVWLVINETPGLVSVSINGVVVGQASRLSPLPCPARFDIAAHLAASNELAIDLASAEASLGDVRLELES